MHFYLLSFLDEVQNSTIEERVSLLELQVADLDEDVDFLFDEQVIQDERLLNVEETSDQVAMELAEISVDLLGNKLTFVIFPFYLGLEFLTLNFSLQISISE